MSEGTFVPVIGWGVCRSGAHPIATAAASIARGGAAILELRCQAADAGDLETLLAVAGQEFTRRQTREHPVRFRVVVEGQRRQLKSPVLAEICHIGRELLRNAFQHANARQIEVEIRYRRSALCLHVRDDGQGIDPEILGGGRNGHWGLAGIRERTNRIGAKLDFWSKPGAGTEAQLTVPSPIAYTAAERATGFSSFLNHLMPFTRR
jgi:signal transduction histidine kinase